MIFWFIHQIIEPISFLIKKIEYLLSKDLLNWIVSAIKIFILILGFAAVLELWGIKIGPIIAGLGLFGVAVALGAQDLFKNLISGILVLIEKRFKVGDVINVENVIEGVVEKISFRSTSVRRFDKSLCTIPNFQFAENAVTNISEITNRRINWVIGLEYGSTVDQLKKIKNDIYNFIENSEFFFISDSTRPIVRIDQFSDSSIDILVRCFIKTNDYDDWLRAKDKLAIGIKEIVENEVNGANVYVAPLGVDTSIFYPDEQQRLKNNNKFIVFNCGKWEVRKGHDILLECFQKAFPQNEDVELWMSCHNPIAAQDYNTKWSNLYQQDFRVRIIPRTSTHKEICIFLDRSCDLCKFDLL